MHIDKGLEFADAVSVALVAGTTNLGSQIDVSVARDVGAGEEELYLVVTVDTAIVTGGAAGTIQFALVSDDSAAISTTTRSVHLITPAYVTDDDPTIPAGTVLFAGAIPLADHPVSVSVAGVPVTTGPGAPYEQFLGVQVIVGTTTITAGKVNAFLTTQPPGSRRKYADASN